MKIYTRTGDDGTTGLIGGSRVRKCDPRLDCCGTLDELNAAIGLAAVAAPASITERLRVVQQELFAIGAHLAAPGPASGSRSLPPLDGAMVSRLESQIDEADARLPPLRQFILPGGSEAAARLHLARAVCRRAERVVVEFSTGHSVPPLVVQYLNRLSDWLFVQARLANHDQNIADLPWTPDLPQRDE